MNERIKELRRQATLVETYTANDGSVHEGKSVDLEKFAELIVKECAKFCDEVINETEIAMEQCEMVETSDRLMMLHDGTRNGAQMSKNRFKKHFGVES